MEVRWRLFRKCLRISFRVTGSLTGKILTSLHMILPMILILFSALDYHFLRLSPLYCVCCCSLRSPSICFWHIFLKSLAGYLAISLFCSLLQSIHVCSCYFLWQLKTVAIILFCRNIMLIFKISLYIIVSDTFVKFNVFLTFSFTCISVLGDNVELDCKFNEFVVNMCLVLDNFAVFFFIHENTLLYEVCVTKTPST